MGLVYNITVHHKEYCVLLYVQLDCVAAGAGVEHAWHL